LYFKVIFYIEYIIQNIKNCIFDCITKFFENACWNYGGTSGYYGSI